MTVNHTRDPRAVDIIALSEKLDITELDVRTVAEAVSGSDSAAEYFMTHPNPVLRNRTPQEAVRAGEGSVVMGLLLNAAGV